jgi:hypothetical protein
MRAKVVSDDLGARKMVPKHELLKNIPLHIQKLNYEKTFMSLRNMLGKRH